MANDENVLYSVVQRHWLESIATKIYKIHVFRTRKAAREFVTHKKATTRSYVYRWQIKKAVWGPDNIGGK